MYFDKARKKPVKIRFPLVSATCIFSLLILKPYSATLALLLSAVIHEAGHITVMNHYKNPPSLITIYPCGAEIIPSAAFGGKTAIAVSAAGPIANIIIALLFCALSGLSAIGGRTAVFLSECAFSGFALALFNLLPLSGLDGGFILKEIEELLPECRIYSCLRRAISNAVAIILWLCSSFFLLSDGNGLFSYSICLFIFFDTVFTADYSDLNMKDFE